MKSGKVLAAVQRAEGSLAAGLWVKRLPLNLQLKVWWVVLLHGHHLDL